MANLGRQVSYGLGIGADVTPSIWLNQLNFSLAPKVEYATNNSAYGRIERTNSATPIRQWAEGSLEHKLTTESAGHILLGAFGTVATANNADVSTTVKDHTFTLNQNVNGQLMTLVSKDELLTEKFTSARFGKWTLNFNLDDYATMTSNVMARTGTATTATVAYPASLTEFVAKHFSIKTAANLAGLAGATNASTVESFSLTVNPNIEPDYAAGSDAPYAFSSRGYDMSFEMTTRYDDTTYRTAYKAGTPLALQVTLKNTDVTIGTAANPGLVLTAPKFNITDWTLDGDPDDVRTQTMTGSIHFSPADAYALRAVLTNTVVSYV